MFLDYYLRIKIKRSHMDILEITQKQDPLYPTFEQIYTASFPLFEQRTEEQQEQAFQSPNYHLVAYLKDNLFIGFISYFAPEALKSSAHSFGSHFSALNIGINSL